MSWGKNPAGGLSQSVRSVWILEAARISLIRDQRGSQGPHGSVGIAKIHNSEGFGLS